MRVADAKRNVRRSLLLTGSNSPERRQCPMKRIAMLAALALIIGTGAMAAAYKPVVSTAPQACGSPDCAAPALRHRQLACNHGWPNNCPALPEPADTGLPQGRA